jgi:NAD-dependent dihydropyrimidine dehydrogenase PreA subunit/flavodoxin
MKKLHIAVVYFSGTTVTKSYAEIIHAQLNETGCNAELTDITPHSARRKPLHVESYDGIIFGFPVYADFPPRVINEWLPTLKGNGKPCVLFVTYGGRTSGYAHFYGLSLLRTAGFRVQFSAEFLGRHTFNIAGWNLLPNRPNEQDFKVAREFAMLAAERFTRPYAGVFSLQKPFGYDRAVEDMEKAQPGADRKWTNPVREGVCSLCGTCEQNCPARAIDHRTGISDPVKCIECMRCVYDCPEKVLKTDKQMEGYYPTFLEEWGLTDELLSHKQSRIITVPWQAVG